MGRHANPDIRRAFQEYTDESTPSKCAKVRCLHCGFTRAKNTTRQIEHLQSCQAYLNSPDATMHLQQGTTTNIDPNMTQPDGTPNRGILNGTHPNPNLQVHRRGPNTNKRTREGQPIAPHPGPPPQQSPSLVAHLLNRFQAPFTAATQQPFLSHAGCGTLSAPALTQWLVQDAHYARGYIRFIGNMLAKLRLPVVPNSQFHQTYRVMDLLISALNNIRREMTFFEITATKFGLQMTDEPPNRITRAYLDLFLSSTSSGASLLEGMVVLWATEHCYRTAWSYASSFTPTLSTPSNEPHIVALHQQLIPNWTSAPFSKFVDACRSLVDELANTTTSPNGKEEMLRCEQLFEHVCWLEERFWPDVDGMGEEDETARLATHGAHHSASAAAHTHPTHSMTGGGMAGSSTPNMGMSGGMNASMGSGMGGMETPSRDSGGSFSGALNGIAEAANGTPGS
ncbi:hypothetical protein BFW01_g6395 [Lasiodiplodia theobromae]|uniref:Thiaminase-2/PQQC domain-containing protein n=2 Tax=Lasiodiplodia TaxID=66739 RepID=A0A5N5D0J0_9PEZI|nr:Transcription regulator [Lasiodiplodia theobromae]KAB2570904.1 hypothetical protein DBV05_g10424 [Lasiodiplodia theobromae]KAF4542065.1 Transcription regulator [Lasiodiplodia theobromae]KAF9635500.1 hypothetical protein BFW01_g6395 [Lasiodiplodia theobromae]KAK0665005.1 hypothetical protein DIS24_g191 [Lasiodiplodia hormozganensis]